MSEADTGIQVAEKRVDAIVVRGQKLISELRAASQQGEDGQARFDDYLQGVRQVREDIVGKGLLALFGGRAGKLLKVLDEEEIKTTDAYAEMMGTVTRYYFSKLQNDWILDISKEFDKKALQDLIDTLRERLGVFEAGLTGLAHDIRRIAGNDQLLEEFRTTLRTSAMDLAQEFTDQYKQLIADLKEAIKRLSKKSADSKDDPTKRK